ncbi:MAG: hypothetical protein ACPGR2_13080 [Psychrobium sp.]
MDRGIYGILLEHPIYQNSKKDWIIETARSDMIWYDLMFDPFDELDTRPIVLNQLKQFKKDVESSIEKRFIYFICTRKKVRFSEDIKPEICAKSSMIKLTIIVGDNESSHEVFLSMHDLLDGASLECGVSTTDKFLTIQFESGDKLSLPIHDFLNNHNIDLGINTEVHYIGLTKNPESRPIDGSHKGLNKLLYKIAMDGSTEDVFIFFNIFKVNVNAVQSKQKLNLFTTNSVIDEIDADVEGEVLEKCLITYFDTEIQENNKLSEKGRLKNVLGKMFEDNNISSILFYYDIEPETEYWKFYSDNVSPKIDHYFKVEYINKEISITDIE